MLDFYKQRRKLAQENKGKRFQWLKGRQIGDFEVMVLCRNQRFLFDMYFIRYKEGAYIPPHVDKAETGKHYRLNVILWSAKVGGEFVGEYIWRFGPFIFFRPDLHEHSVTPVVKGVRYIFSLGWIKL